MSVKHTIRNGNMGTVELTLPPRTAIKRMCDECMGWKRGEVERCTAPLCPLFPFRLGDSHSISSERRSALAKRGQKSTIGKQPIHNQG